MTPLSLQDAKVQPARNVWSGADAQSTAPDQTRVRRRATGVGGYWRNDGSAAELWRSTDLAVAFAALLGAFLVTNAKYVPNGVEQFLLVRMTTQNVLLLCCFIVMWPIVFSTLRLYDPDSLRTPRQEVLRVFGACSVLSSSTTVLLLTGQSPAFTLSTLVVFWIFSGVGILMARHLSRILLAPPQATSLRQVLIVGSGPRALRAYRALSADPYAQSEVVGFLDSTIFSADEEIRARAVGTLDDLESILMRQAVDEVLIALPIRSCYQQIQTVIAVCERLGVESRLMADLFQYSLARTEYQKSAHLPVVTHKVVHDDFRLVFKRAFDLIGAGIGIIVLSPLFIVIALGIKLTSPGPILFTQQRYGFNRRLFRMYKFRTMVSNAEALQISLEHLNEATGPVFKIRNDPRVTPLGAFLRRSSLDELPQLFNVIKGNMSLVGPRPLPSRDVHHFHEGWLMRRFSVRPGLTCLWQVSGRSNLGFDDWVTMDLSYIDGWSLGLDFKILLRTIPAVLKGTGAS